jgi:hypothetical protein
MSDTSELLPLFPLNTVLFPGGPLSLRIFETRYVDMVRRCMRQQSGFGVLQIREGREAGGAVATATTGTRARIVDFNALPDGLLGIVCRGEARFRVVERTLLADGLNVGRVEWLDEPAPQRLPEEFRSMAGLLRRVLPELGGLYEGVETRFEDAGWVGMRLAEILPLEQQDKQLLLEVDDPVERLARLAPFLRRADDA